MMGYGGIAGMGLFGPVGMLIGMAFWVVVVVLAVWGVSTLFSGASGPQHAEEPLTILQRRFARGEINQAEYDQAKRTLD
ncbi:MAG: SHOCT domain-containing protein [Chloroflexi bacterium]|nr:SHOCT domain-containing protein [Chloroflexota bacterium]